MDSPQNKTTTIYTEKKGLEVVFIECSRFGATQCFWGWDANDVFISEQYIITLKMSFWRLAPKIGIITCPELPLYQAGLDKQNAPNTVFTYHGFLSTKHKGCVQCTAFCNCRKVNFQRIFMISSPLLPRIPEKSPSLFL